MTHPTLLQPTRDYEAVPDADLLALARVFPQDDVARLFDVPPEKLAKRIARAQHDRAEKAARRPRNAAAPVDIFFVRERVGDMLRPYLEDPDAVASPRELEKLLGLAIQYTELTEKTWKIVQERMQAREIGRAIFAALDDVPDRLKIIERWKNDPALAEFIKG